MSYKNNINGKYFYLKDDYSENYVKVLDSKYNSKFNEYEINRCLYISDNYIALCDDTSTVALGEEITKKEFMKIYNEVLSEIQKNV